MILAVGWTINTSNKQTQRTALAQTRQRGYTDVLPRLSHIRQRKRIRNHKISESERVYLRYQIRALTACELPC